MPLTLYLLLLLSRYDQFRVALRRRLPSLLSFSRSVWVYEWDKSFEADDINPEVIDKYYLIEELTLRGYFSPDDADRVRNKLREKYPNAWRAEGYALMWLNGVAFREFPPEAFYILHELLHLYYGVGDEIITNLCVDRFAFMLVDLTGLVPIEDREAQPLLDFVVGLSKKAYREPEKLRGITKSEDPKKWIKAGCLWDHDRLISLCRRANLWRGVLTKNRPYGSAPCARQQVLRSRKADDNSREEGLFWPFVRVHGF